MRKKLPEVPVSAAEKKDPGLHMEMETLRAERDERHNAGEAQAEREKLIARYHEGVGQIKTANMFAEFSQVSALIWIQQMRDTKLYKEFGTWESFCESIGYTRQHIEEQLKNLSAFGEKFTQTVCALGVGYRQLRQLRQLTHDGTVIIDGDCLKIENETIPIDQDHAEDLQAAIERIIADRQQIHQRVDKLEKQFKAAVDEEVKGLKTEKKALLNEVERLKAFDPADMDDTRFEEQYETIRESINTLACQIGKLIMVEGLHENPLVAAKVEGHIASAERLVEDLRRDWTAKFQIY